MDTSLKIGMLEADVAWLDIDANLATLEEYFHEHVIDRGYEVMILPEMFTTGFGKQVAAYAEFMNGRTHKWLKNMASVTQALILGSIPVKENGLCYNRLMCVYPDGATKYYNKKHLFGYGAEGETFNAGKDQILIQYKGFVICPLVCYDLRFPVWSRHTGSHSYDILVYVANWPHVRQYAWEQLLKARAIENQAYVLGCNRIGTDGNGLLYKGGSLALDCEGYNMGEAHNGIISAVLDLNRLKNFRTQYPFLHDADSFKFV